MLLFLFDNLNFELAPKSRKRRFAAKLQNTVLHNLKILHECRALKGRNIIKQGEALLHENTP
ncbi:MAG: hypothetical protein FD170_2019 [Bacteroidetes bacterium]|nr:MAG: hypothetical protein FD170_2019 [Bacteroidota bacterium]